MTRPNEKEILIAVIRNELMMQNTENGGYSGKMVENQFIFDGIIDLDRLAKTILKCLVFVN
jgi:hypothetical protein